jgi:Raf kinase inhibitor-like YbhB/YbcL family protein
MQLVAPWPDAGPIPARYTCDDADVAPALTWANVPAGTVELALTMVDLDRDFDHWIVLGIDPTLTGVTEGELPPGARVVLNDFAVDGWSGPCPPEGEAAHRYMFTLHALNQQPEIADEAEGDEVISYLNQTAAVQSSITGTYARAG